MVQLFPYINMFMLEFITNKIVLHYKQLQIEIF